MQKAIIIFSSSDSDTEKNSDSEKYFGIKVNEAIPKPKLFSAKETHVLSDRSSDSDSLPELPKFVSIKVNSLKNVTPVKQPICTISTECTSQSTSSESQLSASQSSQRSSASQLSNPDNIEVIFSRVLTHEKGFEHLNACLQDANVAIHIEDTPFPATVHWRETSQIGLLENQLLVCLNYNRVVSMVTSFRQVSIEVGAESLLSNTMKVLNMYPNCRITYVLLGLEKYFKKHKSCEIREFREAISSQAPSQATQKRRLKDNLPRITKIDLEEAMIDVQLQADVNFRLIESLADLSEIVISFTKSIIGAPNKRAKCQHDFSWHVHGDTNGSVKVGKNNEGLYELWVQQLLQFHQVSKDTAQTIAARYPSPQALIQEYRKCGSSAEASKLLQNLEVRRGIGPLATSRRIGPELSFKIHTLLTTTNCDDILHTT